MPLEEAGLVNEYLYGVHAKKSGGDFPRRSGGPMRQPMRGSLEGTVTLYKKRVAERKGHKSKATGTDPRHLRRRLASLLEHPDLSAEMPTLYQKPFALRNGVLARKITLVKSPKEKLYAYN